MKKAQEEQLQRDLNLIVCKLDAILMGQVGIVVEIKKLGRKNVSDPVECKGENMRLTIEQAEKAKRAVRAYSYTVDTEQDAEGVRLLDALAQEALDQAILDRVHPFASLVNLEGVRLLDALAQETLDQAILVDKPRKRV